MVESRLILLGAVLLLTSCSPMFLWDVLAQNPKGTTGPRGGPRAPSPTPKPLYLVTR